MGEADRGAVEELRWQPALLIVAMTNSSALKTKTDFKYVMYGHKDSKVKHSLNYMKEK